MPVGGVTANTDNKRVTIESFAQAQNVTNHPNHMGYSGVMTSPFVGRVASMLNPHKIEVGTRYSF